MIRAAFHQEMVFKYLIVISLFSFISSCQEREFLNQFDPKVPKTLSTSVSPSGSGQITISPSAPNYKSGEMITLTPVPSQHWVFQKWDGDASGTSVPFSLTMDSNKSVVGVFVKKNYPLSVTIQGEGTVSETIVSSPTGREYPHGTVVRLTPIPQQGWIFDSWGGDLSGTDSPKNITVDQEKNVTAKFIRPAISSLACVTATNNGIITNGFSASGVSTVISYTGGDGSTHNGQTVTSTGIIGLTATLAPGTFASGNGTLTYVISGTPSGVGTANFAINIGGKTCIISRTVNAPAQATYPAGSVFCASGATAVVEVVSPTGKIWMDRNLGATRAATSSTDTQAYGDLYQWGRRSDGHQCRISPITTALSNTDHPENGDFIRSPSGSSYSDWRSPQNTNLWQGVNGVNNPCPGGYRLPTETELNAELTSWGTNNAIGAFASQLKLPVTGYRSSLGDFNPGNGLYWSSTVSSTNSRYLFFSSSSSSLGSFSRASGLPVRCLKD